MNYISILVLIAVVIAAWYVWQYYKLRREIDEYATRSRELHTDTQVKELQNLSSALTALVAAFDLRHSTLESERARLATVLDQITDGVLIADANGMIRLANPAAGRLFQTSNPVDRSIAEVVRHHQLWKPGGAASKRASCKASRSRCRHATNISSWLSSRTCTPAAAFYSSRI